MSEPDTQPETSLFGDDPLAAFETGAAADLVRSRKRSLGNLLSSERAIFYVQLLYRMLLFRRDHELEPLNDDIFEAICEPQSQLSDGQTYTTDQFNHDIHQLEEWELITGRIERERLRGYRDTRKRKFRYRLDPEVLAFLEWLEERAQADGQQGAPDTRNLMEEVCGSLRELRRLLNRIPDTDVDPGEARRALYQFTKLENLTLDINSGLGELNARLLGFVLHSYDLDEAQQIIKELDHYIHAFLQQVVSLRKELLPEIEKLRSPRLMSRVKQCAEVMEVERREAPHLVQNVRRYLAPELILGRLDSFYRAEGKLDNLCHRIHESALKVWGKLRAHLRELERKNHRIEDIRDRLSEMAQLPADGHADSFLTELVAPATMRADMHYWDEHEKAEPPQPRRDSVRRRRGPPTYLKSKAALQGGAPIKSLDEQRLDALKTWLQAHLPLGTHGSTTLSTGRFECFEDLPRVVELARAGILGKGRRLTRVGYEMTPLTDSVTVEVDNQRIRFNELEISHKPDSKS